MKFYWGTKGWGWALYGINFYNRAFMGLSIRRDETNQEKRHVTE